MQVDLAQKGSQFHRSYIKGQIRGLLREIETLREVLENVVLAEGHVQTLERGTELPDDDFYLMTIQRNTCDNCLRIIMPFEKAIRYGQGGIERNHQDCNHRWLLQGPFWAKRR